MPYPRLPVRWRRVLWTLLAGVVIVLLVLGSGYFFGRGQIGDFMAGKLGARLAEDGVFIGWNTADWLPGTGVRMHGLALYRDAARHDRLALFGLVTARRADPSWFRWDKMNFKAADTQLLLGTGATETRLDHMEVLLLIQPGNTDLQEFHARLQGCQIDVKCALEDVGSAGNAEAIAAARQVAQREGLFRDLNLDWLKLVKEWLVFQPEKDEPELKMDLRALPGGSGLSLAITFDGSMFHWRGQKWDFVHAAAKIPIGGDNPLLEIDHIRIGHGGRTAEIAGAFDSTSRLLRIIKFDSGIDALALARAMVPEAVESLSAASTSGAWQISGTAELPMDHPENLRCQARAALDGDLVYESKEIHVTLQKPAFSLRVEEQAATLSDFKSGLWEGDLEAARLQVRFPSRENELRFETELMLTGAQPQSVIKSFGVATNRPQVLPLDWKGAWRIRGRAQIPVDQPEHFRWNGNAALDGEFVYANGKTNIALQNPTFSVRAAEQVVTLTDFKAGLWEGSLDAAKLQVRLPSPEKELRIEMQLSLDGTRLPAVLSSLGAVPNESGAVPLNWKGAWQISGTAEIPVEHPEKFRCHGHSALDGELIYAGGQTNAVLRRPAFSFRGDEQTVSITDLEAGLWEGNLQAPETKIQLPSKDKKLRIETRLTLGGTRLPAIISCFSEAGKQPGRVPLDWKGAWRISGTAEIPADDPGNFRWNGRVALDGDLVYTTGQTSIALQKPTFSARSEARVVTLSDLKAGLWEGTLDAPKVRILLPEKERNVRIETQFTLNGTQPRSVRKSFSQGQKQPRVVRLYWTGAWQVTALGEIPVDHPENFRWTNGVTLDGDLGYASGDTNVALRKPVFSVRAEKEGLAISDFKAGLWEGSLSVPRTLVSLPSGRKKPRFEMQLTISDARLQSIISSFGGSQKQPGKVQFTWRGGGAFDQPSLAGSGALSISEGEFGRMPIVGPLHLMFSILAPRFRKETPSTMTVNHRVAANQLYLKDLKLVSDQAHIDAQGTIDLAREYAQFRAKGRLRRLPGIVTVLLAWLFEFKGEGPVDNIRWSFKTVPGFHLLSKVAQRTAPPESASEKEADRAVKGLIELPGKVVRD